MPARALWQVAPGVSELRACAVAPAPGQAVVEVLYSGISRGTERLVAQGRVPASEQARMRAPMQDGDFPFPVKYGYAAVGRVAAGPMAGQAVFALHPHQDRFACDPAALTPLPEGLDPARAVLAANMETALTILWDSGAGPGDRVAVVGAGVVGALAGYLAARLPGTQVTLIDTNPARAGLAAALGCRFATPADAGEGWADVVIHASANPVGLATAIALAGPEATVVEASWYGAGTVPVPLGGAFHSQRLRIVGSQVGRIPPARAPRWTYGRRMGVALSLLADPALDALVSGETDFADLPARYAAILDDPETLCHRIRYT
ncbi:MAG TPA: zinc-binding alcohol dehydrogenase [Paracoccaceae bacterium]|nr:zinc-binding alcohol dehydrogenase [Paracoccaceae bacterium]